MAIAYLHSLSNTQKGSEMVSVNSVPTTSTLLSIFSVIVNVKSVVFE